MHKCWLPFWDQLKELSLSSQFTILSIINFKYSWPRHTNVFGGSADFTCLKTSYKLRISWSFSPFICSWSVFCEHALNLELAPWAELNPFLLVGTCVFSLLVLFKLIQYYLLTYLVWPSASLIIYCLMRKKIYPG